MCHGSPDIGELGVCSGVVGKPTSTPPTSANKKENSEEKTRDVKNKEDGQKYSICAGEKSSEMSTEKCRRPD